MVRARCSGQNTVRYIDKVPAFCATAIAESGKKNRKVRVMKNQGDMSRLTQGSATLEYALLMPFILLFVLVVFQCVILMHDKAVLEAVLWRSVQAAAGSWRLVAGNTLTAPEMQHQANAAKPSRDLYWQLRTSLGSDAQKIHLYEKALNQLLCEELGNNAFLPGSAIRGIEPGNLSVRVGTGGGIPFGMLRVSVSVPVTGFVGSWLGRMSPSGLPTLAASVEVLVVDAGACAQDMDWGLQILSETALWEKAEKLISGIHNLLSVPVP